MSFVVTTGNVVQVAVDQVNRLVSVQLLGSWSGLFSSGSDYARPGFYFGVGSPGTNGPLATSDGSFGWYDSGHDGLDYEYTPGNTYTAFAIQNKFQCDRACYYYASVQGWNDAPGGYRTSQDGSTLSFKSYAIDATSGTPSSSSVSAYGATIACDYYPNTNESTASVWLEYKKTADVNWTQAGVADSASGYSVLSISRSLSGLSPSTQYQFRLRISRTTSNATSFTSAVSTFTTLAGVPAVSTDATTNLGSHSATLNGTLTINSGTGVNCYFKWGTSNPPTQNTTANQPMSASGSFSQAISGLNSGTTYYVQAFCSFSYPAGSPVNGTVASFATPVDPALQATQEARMQVYEFTRRYGVALAAGAAPLENGPLAFTLQTPAAANSDTFVSATTFATGDVKISKDGGAYANTTNLPAAVGDSYSLVLTAAEMQANEIDILIRDQPAGTAFRDCHLRVITHRQLGSEVIDSATGAKPNSTGFLVKGYGTGHGISCVGGATGSDFDGVMSKHVLRKGTIATGAANPILDSGASATNDFYKNMLLVIVSGTGAAQARIIKSYDGATKTVTPNRAWSTNPATSDGYIIVPGEDVWNWIPGAELSAAPTFNSTMGQLLQLVFQRFAYKITQTATVQTFLKADATTSLASRTVGDDGVTQTIGMLS